MSTSSSSSERIGLRVDYERKNALERFDVCVIKEPMSDTTKAPVKAMDLINGIKEEVKSTLTQLSTLDVKAEGDKNRGGNIGGETSILLSKISMLNTALDMARTLHAFDNLDARVVALMKAGNDIRSAFIELTDQKDPKAKEYIGSIVKAWDDAVIGT